MDTAVKMEVTPDDEPSVTENGCVNRDNLPDETKETLAQPALDHEKNDVYRKIFFNVVKELYTTRNFYRDALAAANSFDLNIFPKQSNEEVDNDLYVTKLMENCLINELEDTTLANTLKHVNKAFSLKNAQIERAIRLEEKKLKNFDRQKLLHFD